MTARADAGYALEFQNFGVVQFVQISSDPALNAYPFTLTAWVKAGPQPSDGLVATPIISKPFAEFDGWSLSIFNGDVRAMYRTASGANVSGGAQDGMNGGHIGDGQWHHVAFAVDASGGKLYVDGVLRTNTSWSGTPGATTSTSPVYFGRSLILPAQYVGLLDEVTLWNAALTQAEIQANMNRTLTGLESNLIAYYRCDEGTGFTVFDGAPSGGANDRSLNGVVFVPSDAPLESPPVVQTLAASSIGGTSATLNGSVNPVGTNASVWFEWGTTTNYGNVTPILLIGSGTNTVPFEQPLTGLAAGHTYHFRAAASNNVGVAYGGGFSFITPWFAKAHTNFTGGGGVAWGDFDNDGWLDIGFGGQAYAGTNRVGISEAWRNTGDGFSLAYSNFIASADFYSFATWGEGNNDERLDLILGGIFNDFTRVFRNTGDGFTNFFGEFGALPSGPISAWGDYNNDGWIDILHPPSGLLRLCLVSE